MAFIAQVTYAMDNLWEPFSSRPFLRTDSVIPSSSEPLLQERRNPFYSRAASSSDISLPTYQQALDASDDYHIMGIESPQRDEIATPAHFGILVNSPAMLLGQITEAVIDKEDISGFWLTLTGGSRCEEPDTNTIRLHPEILKAFKRNDLKLFLDSLCDYQRKNPPITFEARLKIALQASRARSTLVYAHSMYKVTQRGAALIMSNTHKDMMAHLFWYMELQLIFPSVFLHEQTRVWISLMKADLGDIDRENALDHGEWRETFEAHGFIFDQMALGLEPLPDLQNSIIKEMMDWWEEVLNKYVGFVGNILIRLRTDHISWKTKEYWHTQMNQVKDQVKRVGKEQITRMEESSSRRQHNKEELQKRMMQELKRITSALTGAMLFLLRLILRGDKKAKLLDSPDLVAKYVSPEVAEAEMHRNVFMRALKLLKSHVFTEQKSMYGLDGNLYAPISLMRKKPFVPNKGYPDPVSFKLARSFLSTLPIRPRLSGDATSSELDILIHQGIPPSRLPLYAWFMSLVGGMKVMLKSSKPKSLADYQWMQAGLEEIAHFIFFVSGSEWVMDRQRESIQQAKQVITLYLPKLALVIARIRDPNHENARISEEESRTLLETMRDLGRSMSS
ncbi:MAG: hypothetical protein DHS80DRAFT_23531 [Piptocephalis tieghemiana]|nr:MAG: hypothetical protein DHS80DRAFT_23531 [Piptocephalis tieghemiana]